MYLPKPVWRNIMRTSYKSVVQFVHSDVPVCWQNWSFKDRRRWWRDAELRKTLAEVKLTCKRDRISAIEIWCEYYGYEKENFGQYYARELNKMLASIPALERVNGNIRCGPYGTQRGFRVKETMSTDTEKASTDRVTLSK